jgi:hypothetical protein
VRIRERKRRMRRMMKLLLNSVGMKRIRRRGKDRANQKLIMIGEMIIIIRKEEMKIRMMKLRFVLILGLILTL